MSKVNITEKHFKELVRLIENAFIKKVDFSNKVLLTYLVSSGCVEVSDAKPKFIYLLSKDGIYNSLKYQGYKVLSIDDLIYLSEPSNNQMSKDEVVRYHMHTKAKESKSFSGITFSCVETIDILINGVLQTLNPSIEGSGVFIHYSNTVEFLSDITVIGVENPQVVWYIQRYTHLFEDINKYIFLSLSEYKTNYQYQWLESMENDYIHFGDFDLAGIEIYLKRILPRLKVCSNYNFFIPLNIKELMDERTKDSYASSKLYFKQLKYKDITSEHEDINELIILLNDGKKAFEQECLAQ